MSNNKDVKRGIVLYIDGKEVKNNVTAIKAEIRKLTKELDGMTIGSKEYNEQMKKIRNLNTILAEHRKKLRDINEEHRFSLSKGVDWFNKYAASIATAAAALTGVMFKLNSFRKMLEQREESKANVQALTGLDDAAIDWLEQQAVRLSTTMDESGLRVRKSASEILEAYMMVGSQKPELLSDKEALNAVTIEAMRLSEASGMVLKDAVDATTTSLNQYGEGADKAARFVNVLAAGSKFGAANVESQTAAILKAGTIAATANISFEQLVASIETLGEKGIKNEVAGTGLKTFFTRLVTGAEETNPKIVGLYTALDNLNQKVTEAERRKVGGGETLLKDLFGLEGMQTAMILTQNTEALRKYAEAVTDTNVAMEQAAINSDTDAARRAQIRNELNEQGIILMKELNPAITALLNRLLNWSRYTVSLVRFISRHRATLTLLTAAVALYVTWANRKVIADKLQVLWNERVIATAKSLYKTLAAHPWGMLLTVMAAFVGALIDSRREMAATERVAQKLNDQRERAAASAEDEKSEVMQLLQVARDETRSKEERLTAIRKLNEISPEYLGNLTLEKINTEEATKAVNDYVDALLILKEIEETQNDIHDLRTQRQELMKKGPDTSFWEDVNAGMANMAMTFDQTFGLIPSSWTTTTLNNYINKGADALRGIDKEIDTYTAKIEELRNKLIELRAKAGEGNATLGDFTNPPGGQDTKEQQRVKAELLQIEEDFAQKRLELKRQYLANDEMTEQEYSRFIADLVLRELETKLGILGLEPSKRREIQEKILDMQKKFRDECIKEEEKDIKTRSDTTLAAYEKQYKEEIRQATLAHYQEKTDEEAFQEELYRLQMLHYDRMLEDTAITEEQKTQIREKQEDLRLKKSKEAYDAEMAMSEKYRQIIKDTVADFGESIGELIASGEASMKDFIRETINMALDALEKILEITYLEILAKNIASTTPFNWIGAAKAAAEIAAIKAAFALVKGMVSNFYTGGYTGPGDWNQPQGIVHSNEFVANRYAVANPAVRPVLDLIDSAQRAGSVANITSEDIAAVAGSSAGGRSSAAAPQVIYMNNDRPDGRMSDTVQSLTEVIRHLKSRLDEPFYTINTISGRNGTKAKLDEYERLLNNKSRNRND